MSALTRRAAVSAMLAAAFGSRPLAAAFGSRPLAAAFGSRPLAAAFGFQPLAAAFGFQPPAAAFGSRPLAAASGSTPARRGGPRIAALDWTLASACLSLGLAPAGVAEPRLYGRWVGEPALPANVVDLGLREAPSLEALAELAPDVILVNGFTADLRPRLERIAPTYAIDIYGDARHPLAMGATALRDLGTRFGCRPRAEAVLAEAEAAFDRARAALAGGTPRPVLPFNLVDGRHLRIYGAGSLFADTLARIGLASAWDGATSPWGSATGDLAAVAAVPDAVLALVEPVPRDAEPVLSGDGLWAGLTAGRTVLRLPAVWPFGETGAALRFADLVVAGLAGHPERTHAG